MNYTILMYEPTTTVLARSVPEVRRGDCADRWTRFARELEDAGVFVCAASLASPECATTLCTRDRQRQLNDGPYADTHAQLGGIVVISVPNIDVALQWARRYHRAPGQAIEVRPNQHQAN